MAKSNVQMQEGYSLFEFLKDYAPKHNAKKRCLHGAFLTVSYAPSVPTRLFSS